MWNVILASLVRRVIGYLGVGGLVGFDNDLTQAAGAFFAAGSLAWSLINKVRDYRRLQTIRSSAIGIPKA